MGTSHAARLARLQEARFGTDLKAAREAAGLSQWALAAHMREAGFGQMHQQTIARMEGAQRAIRLGEAIALARLTGMSLDGTPAVAPSAQARQAALRAARELESMSKNLVVVAAQMRMVAEGL